MKKSWFAGKRVIITGATSGIGRKLVDIFLNEYGCEVLGVSRNEEKAQKVYNEISAYTDKYSKYCFDVSDKNSWFCFANR